VAAEYDARAGVTFRYRVTNQRNFMDLKMTEYMLNKKSPERAFLYLLLLFFKKSKVPFLAPLIAEQRGREILFATVGKDADYDAFVYHLGNF